MMEIERLRSIKEQEEQELAVRKMRERGAEQIRQQVLFVILSNFFYFIYFFGPKNVHFT